MKNITIAFLLVPLILICLEVLWEFVIEDEFEEFFGIEEENEGTELGLAITRTKVDHHNGDISVSSKPGEGSKFIITLPVIHKSNQD